MNLSIRNLAIIPMLATAFVAAQAQEAAALKPERPSGVYKVDYVFSEVQGGKRVNVRNYSTLVRVGERGSIRLGDRVPILFGDPKEPRTQLQYLDLGVNIDCRVEQELEAGVGLYTNIDISSVAPQQPGENRTGTPTVRQMKFQFDEIVPVGKQTLIGSADEVDGTRKIEIEVTAAKVR